MEPAWMVCLPLLTKRIASWTARPGPSLSVNVSLSRMTRAFPSPLQTEEIKIQPSLELVNGWNAWSGDPEETSSNSETKLFNFLSPEDTVLDSAALRKQGVKIKTQTVSAERIS